MFPYSNVTISQVRKFYSRQLVRLLVFGVLVSAYQPQLIAQQIHPLTTSNTRPIILIHGIPTSRSAQVAQASEWRFELDSEITNHFSYNYDSNERVRLDGETVRHALSLARGISDSASLEIIVPYISHDGGSLDQFIEDWHDVFGFPQNGRKNNPRDQLNFYYEKNGVVKLNFQQPASGMGDIQLIFAHQIKASAEEHTAFKAAVKLPTGDSDKLTGSGAMAISAWLAGEHATTWFEREGLNYYSVGGMWLEEGEVISDQQLAFAAFGGIGTGIQLGERVVLQVQLDSHTPLYKGSDLRELNSIAFLITMGGNLKLSDHWNIDIAVVEDILPHSAPDVTFHFGVNGRW